MGGYGTRCACRAAVTGARLCHVIDRIVRAVLAKRMTYGATDDLDRVLMAMVAKRAAIERAGWFN